ncbi:comF family protein [Mesonia phycicola]|uniref:ComF family protein n=1 Tax=Mesonia phycicola TaxID=579105 RepID=A0A1M6EN20_9FLAO|nr:phosphoribosyltransferase family protein [Mesonia phycicola]SHI86844.1 comF family protein [Mesonia phycicola]
MFRDLLLLFFPQKCLACNNNIVDKDLICAFCIHQLPVANTYLDNENTLKKVFANKIPITNATTLLHYYKKGITQNLFHNLKYKNHPELSAYFGDWLSSYLNKTDFMRDIEVIIPVPIHKTRFKERGYNQVEGFAKTLAHNFNKTYLDNVLIKKEATKTQVFKSKLAREEIKPNYFSLQNNYLIEGKHVLLVDDIITTGSTLTSCGKILLTAKNIKLSIASIAYTP